jgi:23S rRNA (uracil1939-C5)-methyltransferase
LELTIEKLVYGGDGLARLPADASGTDVAGKGKAVFVPFVLAGEEITATLTEQRPGFARGRLDSVMRPAAARVQPPCRYFAACGGCHYQHASYEEQLKIKAEILRENLRRLAKLELPVEIEIHAASPWNYRNRTRLALRHESGFKLGYRRFASEEVLPVEECPISSPLLQQGMKALCRLGRAGQVPASLREVEFLANADDTKLMLSFFQAGRPASLESLVTQLQAELLGLETVALFRERTHSHKGQDEENERPQILAGTGSLRYNVSGHAYQVSAGAFFQSNRHLIADLVRIVTTGRAGGTAAGTVLDLYAGGGLFSVPLAAQFERVVAVESSPLSFRDLRRNLPPHAKAVRVTAEAFLQEEGRKPRPDLIVADPPRTGLGAKVARSLVQCRAPRVTYVSCDPATLARDLAILTEGGYQVEAAHLIDIFPQTYHLETVLHLTRRESQ